VLNFETSKMLQRRKNERDNLITEL